MGDGEGFVIAYVLAAGLLSVAVEGRLLVAPGGLHGRPKDQDPEDEEDGEPHLPPSGGVGLDLVQQAAQSTPVTHPLAGNKQYRKVGFSRGTQVYSE